MKDLDDELFAVAFVAIMNYPDIHELMNKLPLSVFMEMTKVIAARAVIDRINCHLTDAIDPEDVVYIQLAKKWLLEIEGAQGITRFLTPTCEKACARMRKGLRSVADADKNDD